MGNAPALVPGPLARPQDLRLLTVELSPRSDLQRIGEDVPTETGVEMTRALAEYWTPVLARAANSV
jgi:hypothetical protein